MATVRLPCPVMKSITGTHEPAKLIQYEISNIIHGGETNYITATVTLYVSIFNLFTCLLHLLGFMNGEQ